MDVRCCSDTGPEAAAWDAYVNASASATSDHRWAWRRILAAAFGYVPYYLGAFEDEQLAGILPLFLVPRGFGRATLCSIPFGNYGGVCADAPEALRALLAAAKKLMQSVRAEALELHQRTPIPDETLQQPCGGHSRFVLPLAGDPAVHLRQMGQDNRSKVRRSQRRGLRLELSHDVSRLYPIYLHTARRQGVPCFPRCYFERIVEEHGEDAQIFFATLDGRPVAYYLALFFKDSLVCQFAGCLASSYAYYPNEFLFWCGIEQGCARKLQEFDFCRSRRTSGTAAFKRKLRFLEQPLEYQYYLPNGRRLSERPPRGAIARPAIQAWRTLPLWCTELLGPRLVRYLA